MPLNAKVKNRLELRLSCQINRNANSEPKPSNKEDIRVSNEYRIKLIACEDFQSFLTVLHVGNSIVIYEITSQNDDGVMDQDVILQLYVSTMS